NKDHLDDFEECKGGSVTFGDASGISMLPNTEIFEEMGNMGCPADVVARRSKCKDRDQAEDNFIFCTLTIFISPPVISSQLTYETYNMTLLFPQSQDLLTLMLSEAKNYDSGRLYFTGFQLESQRLLACLETELKQTRDMGKRLRFCFTPTKPSERGSGKEISHKNLECIDTRGEKSPREMTLIRLSKILVLACEEV
ncbi:hypothetical protein Tco_0631330, partial [Tanacetum coccineum]